MAQDARAAYHPGFQKALDLIISTTFALGTFGLASLSVVGQQSRKELGMALNEARTIQQAHYAALNSDDGQPRQVLLSICSQPAVTCFFI
jgi:hypothetical protein